MTSNVFFQLNTCSHSPYITSSLMRGWICHLQLLPALASTFSGPSHIGLMTTFYCLRFETPPNLVGQVPIFITPRNRVVRYTPTHWVPFSSPPTTHRATVEVFDPTSTWDDSSSAGAFGTDLQKTPFPAVPLLLHA
jgi:hypothetical protein